MDVQSRNTPNAELKALEPLITPHLGRNFEDGKLGHNVLQFFVNCKDIAASKLSRVIYMITHSSHEWMTNFKIEEKLYSTISSWGENPEGNGGNLIANRRLVKEMRSLLIEDGETPNRTLSPFETVLDNLCKKVDEAAGKAMTVDLEAYNPQAGSKRSKNEESETPPSGKETKRQ